MITEEMLEGWAMEGVSLAGGMDDPVRDVIARHVALQALQWSLKANCGWCNGHALAYSSLAIGPNEAGNWTHRHLDGNQSDLLCANSAIIHRAIAALSPKEET